MKIRILFILIMVWSTTSLSAAASSLATGFYYITNDTFIKKGVFLSAENNELVMARLSNKQDITKQWKLIRNNNGDYIIAHTERGNVTALTGGSSPSLIEYAHESRQLWQLIPVFKGAKIYRIHNKRDGMAKVLNGHSSGSKLLINNAKERTPGTFWHFLPIKNQDVVNLFVSPQKIDGGGVILGELHFVKPGVEDDEGTHGPVLGTRPNPMLKPQPIRNSAQ